MHIESDKPVSHIQDTERKKLIQLNKVVKTFKSTAGTFMALKGIDAEINSGEFVSIVGKSGSGKTTLINMLTGIDRPSHGEIFVAGTAIHDLDEGEMVSWRGINIGIVFQFFQLLPTLTVLENVRLPMDFCNIYRPNERNQRAIHLLDLVGIQDFSEKLPSQLSGGQQQSAAIARALANDPKIVVADEPTGNLDSHMAEKVINLLEKQVEEGKTILMVTHDNDLAKRASRTITLADGVIIDNLN